MNEITVTGRKIKPGPGVSKLNPHLFVRGELAHPVRKPDALQALDRGAKVRGKRKGRVEVVVSIMSLRHREIDDDNLIAGAKPLRDAIAETLQTDDGDRRIRWEYGQFETRAEEGTIVMIWEVK